MNDNDPAPRGDIGTTTSDTSGVGRLGLCEIVLQNPRRYAEAGARQVRPWLTPLVAGVAPAARSLTVRFTSDREMRRLNHQYRQQDKATDVLTFPGDLPPAADCGIPRPAEDSAEAHGHLGGDFGHLGGDFGHLGGDFGHLGDIVIAVPTARRQAESLGHSSWRELRVLLLHGVLHCLGYDHETDDGTMHRVEQRLRRRWIA